MSRVIFLLCLVILGYLFCDAYLNIEIAASKNNTFTQIQKQEIDALQNIDSVKQLGKIHLDTIRRVQRNYSRKALINAGLLVGVILLQIILFSRRKIRKS